MYGLGGVNLGENVVGIVSTAYVVLVILVIFVGTIDGGWHRYSA